MEDSKKRKDPFKEFEAGKCETCKDKDECSYVKLMKHPVEDIGNLITRLDDDHMLQWVFDPEGNLNEEYSVIDIDGLPEDNYIVKKDEVFVMDMEDDTRNIGVIQIPMLGIVPDYLRDNPFLMAGILGKIIIELTYDFSMESVLSTALKHSDNEIGFLYEQLIEQDDKIGKLKNSLDVEKKLNIRDAEEDSKATIIPLRFR